MTNDTILRAIFKINPNAQCVVGGNSLDEIKWLDGTTPISKADIEAQFPTVELEIALKDLRQKRNELLADTDYLALSDNTLSSDMTTYRQALRDLTNGLDTVDKVNNVTYPTKP